MCGAYTLDKELDQLMKRFAADTAPEGYRKRYNVRPTQAVPVILNTRPGLIELARWGITPAWDKTGKKQLINARKDGLDKPTFRKSFNERRCLVLADGFYEWMQVPGQSRKRPFRFVLKSEEPFAFAGIWREQEGEGVAGPHCAIITTEPNGVVGKVHDRMPAILRPEAETEWLSLDTSPEQALELLAPYPDAEMRAYEVSTLVNSPAHDSPEVTKPAA
jgi:putative SOS response-associated peptidase YedK